MGQDHSKLDSNIIAEAITSLVKVDPLINVKTVIAEVQSKFNYNISYRKAWLAKKKVGEKNIWRLRSIFKAPYLQKLIVNIGNIEYVEVRYSRTVHEYNMRYQRRPRMTHFLNEMDMHMLRGPRRCRQCGVEDRSRSRCRQSSGASAGNNAL
ncbi:hypothetical protein Ahy_B10g104821 [Arachis hypogaea]|uniref:Uncharacterized protein n=1 Tax=Arachis hypogaea TaxID=3818 RepID=A0A444X6K5_ARAHY|nr:hypothetical protein Ahy_B10g104821 [Arachis hypogaea]